MPKYVSREEQFKQSLRAGTVQFGGVIPSTRRGLDETLSALGVKQGTTLDWLRQYWEDYSAANPSWGKRIPHKRSPETLKNVEKLLVAFARWLHSNGLSRTDVADVTQRHLNAFLACYNNKPGQQSHAQQYVRQFFNALAALEHSPLRKNPADRWAKVKHTPKETPYLLEDDIQRLRVALELTPRSGTPQTQTVARLQDDAMFALWLETGLRRSEIANLTTDSIDLQKRELVVKTKTRDRLKLPLALSVEPLKRYIDVRRLPYPRHSERLMRTHHFRERVARWNAAHPERKFDIDHPEKDKYLFRNPDGFALTPSGVGSIIARWKGFLDAHLHPHVLRKTAARLWRRNGMPIEQISMLLGHKSLKTTKIYLGVDDDELREAIETFTPLAKLGYSYSSEEGYTPTSATRRTRKIFGSEAKRSEFSIPFRGRGQ